MDGKIQRWDAGLTDELLEMVNHVLREELGASPLRVEAGYVFCAAMHDWLDRLFVDGPTEEMIAELNTELEDIRFQHVLEQTTSGRPKWDYIVDFGPGLDPDSAAAYGFSHLLEAGALDGLKRCQMEDCENFFIGRPNAKWCSKKCGSLHRVRSMRERDR